MNNSGLQLCTNAFDLLLGFFSTFNGRETTKEAKGRWLFHTRRRKDRNGSRLEIRLIRSLHGTSVQCTLSSEHSATRFPGDVTYHKQNNFPALYKLQVDSLLATC